MSLLLQLTRKPSLSKTEYQESAGRSFREGAWGQLITQAPWSASVCLVHCLPSCYFLVDHYRQQPKLFSCYYRQPFERGIFPPPLSKMLTVAHRITLFVGIGSLPVARGSPPWAPPNPGICWKKRVVMLIQCSRVSLSTCCDSALF